MKKERRHINKIHNLNDIHLLKSPPENGSIPASFLASVSQTCQRILHIQASIPRKKGKYLRPSSKGKYTFTIRDCNVS
jgi:hypothetical protein